MPHPADPEVIVGSLKAASDYIELRSTFRFLNEEDRNAFLTHLGAAAGYTVASQAEMEAGTEAALRSMSPLRIAQAIAALAPAGGGGAWGSITGALTDQTDLSDALDAKAQIRVATATLTPIVEGAAATPAHVTFNPGGGTGSDGDTLTVIKTGAGAGTVVFEIDPANDGVSGSNVSMGLISSIADIATWLAANVVSFFSGQLVITYDGTNITITTVDTGSGASFGFTGTGIMSQFNPGGAGGTDAVAETGTRAAVLLAAEAGKKHLVLSLYFYNAGTVWSGCNEVSVGYGTVAGNAATFAETPYSLASENAAGSLGGSNATFTPSDFAASIGGVALIVGQTTDETAASGDLQIVAVVATIPD